MPRLFIAFPLAEPVRAELLARQALLRHRREAVSWVTHECLHLTAVFLGECPVTCIPAVLERLEDTARRQEPLVFRLGSPGFFGSADRPRVLYTGLEGPGDALLALVTRLEGALRRLGLAIEKRRYRPHITLGRVRSGGAELAAAHMSTLFLPVTVHLDRLELYESRLHAGGPEYRPLGGCPLGREHAQ